MILATFLSMCGQTEFNEKLDVLTHLKSEWQCSQATTTDTLTKELNQTSELTQIQSAEELEKFKHIHMVNTEPDIESNNSESTLTVPLPYPTPDKHENDDDNVTQAKIFDMMKDIKWNV